MASLSVSFGKYQCIKKIGAGGMSDVYLCTDKHIGKKWAMKVIPLKDGIDAIAKSEISLLKSLDYMSFPRITDAFLSDNKICIVTDFIDGKNLSSVIKEEGRLPQGVVVDYFLTLIRALMYLHSLTPPILYLDLKPSNIMLKNDGAIQLIDFGIAQTIIMKGRGFGSVGYSPPEQYKENAVLDERSDVYALGMTIYALLSGHEILHDYDKQIKIIQNDRSIDTRLKNLILKCVSYNPNGRPYPEEIEKQLIRIKNKSGGMRVLMLETLFTGLLFFAVIAFLLFSYKKYESRKYADEMLEAASKYMTDGSYTMQGIKIICAYIDGNFLDEKTEEYFTYEAARNYFEIQRDYLTAKRYFERLPEKKYPEVRYYIRLCRLLTGFEKDSGSIREVVSEFRKYNESLSDLNVKEKNDEMLTLILKENDAEN